MPALDTRITLQRFGLKNFNYVGPATHTWKLWSRSTDGGTTAELTERGFRTEAQRTFMIRYLPDMVAAGVDPDAHWITDDHGIAWRVITIQESDERRRYVNLQCILTEAGIPATP